MTTFDRRKDAFENKFVHDAELRFRAQARRNKLLGRWAAEAMGLSGDAAESYSREVVQADLQEAGEEDVFRKISNDLAAAGVVQSEHQIRRRMDELMQEAVEQVRSETRPG
jgi:hypothetical protein